MKKFFCFVLSLVFVCNIYSVELKKNSVRAKKSTQSNSSLTATSLDLANRKTALRYLQLAKNYSVQNDWTSVVKLCSDALKYDDSIADLHYLSALSFFNLNEPRYKILDAVQKSLSGLEFVDYNKDSARVFYADILCQVGKPDSALEILDSAPLIYSADAEFVRVKANYQINSEESVKKAQEKIESARRVYPKDIRFFNTFFYNEFNNLYFYDSEKKEFVKNEISPLAKKIASSFISTLPNYKSQNPDLEIIASFFAEGETKKRLIKSYDARGLKNILFPIAVLEENLILENEALDYFLEFFNVENSLIEEKTLSHFYSLIKDESLKKYFDENLAAFDGTLLYDTNNSLESNLAVKYERGRPASAIFDFNNDNSFEWRVDFDFGVPQTLHVFDEDATIVYKNYPTVSTIAFENFYPSLKENGIAGTTYFEMIDELCNSVPFEIKKLEVVEASKNLLLQDLNISAENFIEENVSKENSLNDFYVIDTKTLSFGSALFNPEGIESSVNKIDTPSLEKKNARVQFSLIRGKFESAEYYTKSQNGQNKIFATTQFFDDGLDYENPIVKKSDKDGDGIFETTEYYNYLPENFNNKNIFSNEELTNFAINVFGVPDDFSNIYLAEVELDTNLDSKIDFTEQNLLDGGKITSWDTDFDGVVDVVYKKFPPYKEKVLKEEIQNENLNEAEKNNLIEEIEIVREENSYLIQNQFNKKQNADDWITIVFNNKIPVLILDDDFSTEIFSGFEKNIFWIGENPKLQENKINETFEKQIKSESKKFGNAQVFIIDEIDCYLNAIKIDNKIFIKKINKEIKKNNSLIEDSTLNETK